MVESSTKMKICGSGQFYVPPNSSVRGYYADMSFLQVDERLATLSVTPCCGDYGLRKYHFITSPNPEGLLGAHVPYGKYMPGNLVHALGYMSGNTEDLLERVLLQDIIILGMRLKQDDVKLVPRLTFVERAATKVRLELVEATEDHVRDSFLFYTAPIS